MFPAIKTVFLVFGAVRAADRSFTDGKGKNFTTSIEKPTIVTWALTAQSLHHYGLDASQLLGTYGEWMTKGSTFDLENPEFGVGNFPDLDPTMDELELLQEVVNVSPGCEAVAGWCTQFDIDSFIALDPDFFIVPGATQDPWEISPLMANITAAGYPEERIIFIEISLSNNGESCTELAHENCHGKSMIDVIETYIELGNFLKLDAPSSLDEGMKDLCSAATTFAAYMKIAQEKGLRVMPAYFSSKTNYFGHATDDMVLRMFEELGMPIMHPGSCETCTFDYFWEYIPTGEYFRSCTDEQKENLEFQACNDDPLYPVDYWLYDHRQEQLVGSEDFKMGFPDQAIQAGSVGPWPTTPKITPGHAAHILNNLGEDLAMTDRIYAETACTPADVTSVPHRITGLSGGEYACWDDSFHNSKYFQSCRLATSDAFSGDNTSEDAAAPSNIVEIAQSNTEFSTLVTAVVAAGLAEALSGDGPFTIFAPNNAAFAALPEGTLDGLLEDKDQLADVLKYHVVSGNIPASEVSTGDVETLLGKSIAIAVTDTGVKINEAANVISTDLIGSNGIIHVIDAVLLPPASIAEQIEPPKTSDNAIVESAKTSADEGTTVKSATSEEAQMADDAAEVEAKADTNGVALAHNFFLGSVFVSLFFVFL